jgi:excinuclease ABC subunit A
MNVDEAVDFFAAHRRIHHALALLQEVGLGYLTLGQQSPTLSGGEAQRIKLVTELAKVGKSRVTPDFQAARRGRTLYVLDEPTVGLHMADVEKLIRVLHRLVDAGNTVVVIEHNLDVIADADWIVDLGPEGGAAGGRIVAQGPPETIVARPGESHTAAILAEFIARNARPIAHPHPCNAVTG